MPAADEVDILLEELVALPDEETRRAFLARPEVDRAAGKLVERLAAKVDFFNRSEPQQGLKLAELALFVAEVKEDKGGQGLARRAKGNALRATGRPQEALPYFSQAADFFKRAGLKAEEGRTYVGEVATMYNLGQYAECLKRGIVIRQRLTRLGDNLNLAKLYGNLAAVNHSLGRFSDSLRYHTRALGLFEALNLPDMQVSVRVNRANSLVQLNRFRQATEDYHSSREFFQQKGMTSLVAVIDTNLGFLLFRQGRYNEALNLLLSARDGFIETGEADKRAITESDLGYCYAELGLFKEALLCYEQAYQTLSELGMKYEALRAEIGWAQVLLNTGDWEEADRRLKSVLQVYDTADSSEQNPLVLGIVWLYQAQIMHRGSQPDLPAALQLCRKARDIFSQHKIADWYAQSLLLEADLLCQLDRREEAEEVYGAALSPVRRLKLPHLLYQFYYGSGKLKQAELNQTSNPEQKKALAQAARQQFLKAARQVESIRAILRPEEWRTAFMENGLGAYEALVELCLQDTSNPKRLEEAFSYVELSKSRSLLDLISQEISPTPEEPDEKQVQLAERVEQLRGELNWFYSQVHNHQSLGPGSESQRLAIIEPEKVKHELGVRERELSNLMQRYRPGLLERAPENFSRQGSGKLVNELASFLGPGRALVEYYVLRGEVMAFVLTGEGIQIHRQLCSLEEVRDLQERLNYQAEKFSLGSDYIDRYREALQKAFDLYLHKLYRCLVAPLAPILTAKSLVIVPHGAMHTLPFHAFYDGSRYLLESYDISYAPSTAVLLHCFKQPERQPRKLLAVAVPDETLTGVEAEARALEKYFPDSRLLIGETATLENLNANLKWCDILHIASHGFFREDNPLFSLIHLSDGWLSVQDVMDWRFNPTLVTLSACQTGLNRSLQGDELLGMARAFLSAGAFSLVVSLWSISDEITTRLMQHFYEALAEGESRTVALKKAMLEVKSDSRHAHPHYWAPFMVLGHP